MIIISEGIRYKVDHLINNKLVYYPRKYTYHYHHIHFALNNSKWFTCDKNLYYINLSHKQATMQKESDVVLDIINTLYDKFPIENEP